ncbi:disulfide bond formation protein B [Thalassobius sp. MITS945101]|uniref:disulfide bond formation protein B n=1 Tax=Thalassobius sp. MITS945101 TaxID=3096994 RepID=UPI00399BE130
MIQSLDRRTLIGLATLGSMALLGGAFFFQFLGYAPCKMCLWQRWPHAAAIVIGGAAMVLGGERLLALLGGGAALITGGIGAYHTGVERGWWEGPTSCSGGGNGLDMGNLLSTTGGDVVMCDQVTWQFLSLSMASWNALASFALVALWIFAATRKS